MEKMLKTLLVSCFTFCFVFSVNYASACPLGLTNGKMSGGACSIRDLNNLENNANGDKANVLSRSQRDLRPVRPKSEMQKKDDCLFGMCLYKKILDYGATSR